MRLPVLFVVGCLTSVLFAQSGPSPDPVDPMPAVATRPPVPPPETHGVKVAGKDLKRAVKQVAALRWHDDLTDARAESAATGKPILWLQALGDLEGPA
jgi:hypothetical protein